MMFSVSDTGILRLKENSECSQQELGAITSSDAVPLSYMRLVVVWPLN